jgi:glycine/D-amino acid oxidase-like deaminating enzyme/nitrite reductase/ring-hydroxylating ferredoxin subunit
MRNSVGMDSIWTAGSRAPRPALEGDQEADVAIVGGGIAGLTAAALLKAEGFSVALVEARRIGGGETSRTTAHFTLVRDSRFEQLRHTFGEAGIQQLATAGWASLNQVVQLIRQHELKCDFERLPGYLFTEREGERRALDAAAAAAAAAGVPAERLDHAPLPFATAGAVRYPLQAQLHPGRYLAGLAAAIEGEGVKLYEHSRAVAFEDGDPCVVTTEGGTVRAKAVLVLTDVPVSSRVLMPARLLPYRTYVVAAEHSPALPGLFWDTDSPYHYLRSHRIDDRDWLIVGGEDHKVGEEQEPQGRFDRLENYVRERLHIAEMEQHWSGQVQESPDGIPMIGKSPLARHLYVGTGFGGTGIMDGTLTGMILSGLIAGHAPEWAGIFSPTRIKAAGTGRVLSHGAGFTRHLVTDRVKPADGRELELLPPGEGRVMELSGEKLAVFRDESGAVHALSPVCPHLGCHVNWNSAERSWDCPCHGSRFDARGQVLHGPATQGLAERGLEPGAEAERAEAETGEVGVAPGSW